MRTRRAGERGAAIVEFAIILPVLLILVMGIIDYGRITSTRITLVEAVQEGSIYASTHPDETAAIRQRVVDSVDNPVIDPATIAIECPGSDQLRIRLTHPMDFITPLFGASIDATAEVTTDIFTTSASCVASPATSP